MTIRERLQRWWKWHEGWLAAGVLALASKDKLLGAMANSSADAASSAAQAADAAAKAANKSTKDAATLGKLK